MKKYKPLLLKLDERRMSEYKAWLNPSSGKFIQFSTNGLHQEVSQENFGLDESQAIKRGYYRIFCGHELDIDSYSIPTEREFQTVKYTIDENSIKKFNGTRWNIETQRGFIYFPKLSFLFANSITDGKKKVFEDIKINLNKGDTFLWGKFKNKSAIFDHTEIDDKGQQIIVTDTGLKIPLLHIRLKN